MYRTLATIVTIVFGACSPGPRVEIEVPRGELATAFRFNLRSSDSALAPAPVEMIEVFERGQRSSSPGSGTLRWVLAHQPGTPPLQLPTTVLYGAVVPGYVASGAAPPLTIGTYVVRVRAGGVWTEMPFNVTAANTVE